MGKKLTGGGRTRPITARIPVAVYADLAAVAEARGIDMSALLNQLLAEARPGLVRWLREHEEALATAPGSPAARARALQLLLATAEEAAASGQPPEALDPAVRMVLESHHAADAAAIGRRIEEAVQTLTRVVLIRDQGQGGRKR
jgi:post-segregation antitoxin (ccd killing protein)